MITVWGRATSINVQAVLWAMAELGLPFERHDRGGAHGGLDTPEFLAMNPNRLIPVVRIDEEFLWESAAIIRYLGARYGDAAFWPPEPLERARIDKWAEWTKTSFGPALLTGVFWPLIGVTPEKRDAKAIAAGVERLTGYARMIEARLGEHDYLGGAALSFADVVFGAHLYRYFTLEFDRAETPHLRRYYDRLCARPAYAEHVMVSYDSLRAK